MSLDRSMGHGIIGAEIICEECNQLIDLEYKYSQYLWHGACWQCRLGYVVDLEAFINHAKHGPYNDWDWELKGLMEQEI